MLGTPPQTFLALKPNLGVPGHPAGAAHIAVAHRHGEIARLVISLIVIFVAALVAFEVAPSANADPFLVWLFSLKLGPLELAILAAFINIFMYAIAAMGNPTRGDKRFGRFWP